MAPSTPSLTPTSYVVLGLLEAFGPSTSYDLERTVATSVGCFWSFPRSQLYSEPSRLADLGLLTEQQEQTGRRRRTLTLTEAGRQALHDWLAEPVGADTEIRDLGLLKLFFGGAALSPEHVADSARAQAASHRRQVLRYEELASHQGMEAHQRATLRLGLAYERAAVAFWDEMAGDPGRG
jgi:DNA-binding PadR family transcriptional regulator